MHEAAAIYLAAQLLHRQSDERNPHAVSALVKLGTALRSVAPAMAHGIIETGDGTRVERGRDAPDFVTAPEVVTRAWVSSRWVRIRYRRRGATSGTASRLASYLLEGCKPGFATHVLGRREPPGALRELKVERVVRAQLSEDPCDAPPGLDVARAFAGAWGLWLPVGGETLEAILRYAPRIAAGVSESPWHPSETTATAAYGSIEWRARVGDPTEILPWVLGWGPEVWVVPPAALRERVAGELRAAVARYG